MNELVREGLKYLQPVIVVKMVVTSGWDKYQVTNT
jgi:hypothetical protein